MPSTQKWLEDEHYALKWTLLLYRGKISYSYAITIYQIGAITIGPQCQMRSAVAPQSPLLNRTLKDAGASSMTNKLSVQLQFCSTRYADTPPIRKYLYLYCQYCIFVFYVNGLFQAFIYIVILVCWATLRHRSHYPVIRGRCIRYLSVSVAISNI